MNILAKIILTPFFLIGSALGFYNTPEAPLLGASLPQGVAVFETSLQSPITSSATSMTLTANAVRGGSTLTGYNCFTIDEGSAQAEYVCGTVSGTSVTSLTRGVDPVTATTTNATLQYAHRRGANVKITDFPLIQIMRNQLNGDETLPYSLKYDGAKTPVVGSYNIPSWDYVKTYADALAFAGAPDANEVTKGIVEISTTAEAAAGTTLGSTGARLAIPASMCNSSSSATILCVITSAAGKISQGFLDLTQSFAWTGVHTWSGLTSFTATSTLATTTQTGAAFGGNITNSYTGAQTISGATTPQPVMMATTTGLVSLIESDVASTTAPLLGFAINNCGNGTTCYVQTDGVVKGFSGLTAGREYYVSDTAGTLSTTVGTTENYVGRAISTTAIEIDKNRSGQYLGSASLPATVPIWARYAVVNATGAAGASCTGMTAMQFTLYRVGVTTGSATIYALCGGSNPPANISVSWSGGLISGTYSQNNGGDTGAAGGTAYFYK